MIRRLAHTGTVGSVDTSPLRVEREALLVFAALMSCVTLCT